MSIWRWQPKTAVLLHVFDCRLTQEEWFRVMWGTPALPGRIPTAVAAALESSAEVLLVFRDKFCYMPEPDGRNEAEVIHDTLFGNFDKLTEFASSFPVFGHFIPEDIRQVMSIFRISDRYVVNTDDEVREALPILKEMGIEHVVFVSSFDHISRVAQRVGEFWAGEPLASNSSFRPAPALHSGGSMKDVIVMEPSIVRALWLVHPKRLLGLRGNPEALARVDVVLSEVGV